ncbi:FecCD family ABC transporter permease [Salininema proteolyticum]|uniref:FecCD family ABC transporter permease n=1 Tax=Salininema proteolyticum TaxID=1607685 RepID=A0ABV8U612_9ACTN
MIDESAATRVEAPAPRTGGRTAMTAVGLTTVLLGGTLASAAVGAYPLDVPGILSSVAHHWGLGGEPLPDYGEEVLWSIRLARVALAVLVGASLAAAGALMQGMFANPLAEPGVIGVSSGAAAGAVAAISLGLTAFGAWTLPVAAFAGGLATVAVVYAASRSGGRTETVTLILTGVAVNAFAGALIGVFVFTADVAAVNEIVFWQMGSLAQATWTKVLAVLPFALAGLAVAPLYARRLDLLTLGEKPARHLGVDVERMRIVLIAAVAVLTAAAVAVSGVIGFVGLVVPHLVRMWTGPGHRSLLPLSILGGAAVLVWADLAARTAAAPAEAPLGVLTALVGSPFFFWLLRRTRRQSGGWG